MPLWLSECFEDASIVKVSASFDVADKAKLKHTFRWDFDERVKEASTFLDIKDISDDRELPYGLKKLAGILEAPMLKLKEVGQSNWAQEELTSAQRHYAADDAFFTLYLLGLLYERRAPAADASAARERSALESWRISRGAMKGFLRAHDNREYKRCFLELREVVKDAVTSLSNALGSEGCTALNNLFKVKAVEKALRSAQRGCSISINAAFIKANEDLFCMFKCKAAGVLKIRPRRAEEDDEYNEEEEEDLRLGGGEAKHPKREPGAMERGGGRAGGVLPGRYPGLGCSRRAALFRRWRGACRHPRMRFATTPAPAVGLDSRSQDEPPRSGFTAPWARPNHPTPSALAPICASRVPPSVSAALSAPEEWEFMSRVLDLLAAYEPPAERRQSVVNRMVPEARGVRVIRIVTAIVSIGRSAPAAARLSHRRLPVRLWSDCP